MIWNKRMKALDILFSLISCILMRINEGALFKTNLSHCNAFCVRKGSFICISSLINYKKCVCICFPLICHTQDSSMYMYEEEKHLQTHSLFIKGRYVQCEDNQWVMHISRCDIITSKEQMTNISYLAPNRPKMCL